MAKTLRDHCKEFYQTQRSNALLRQSSPVDDLVAFVMVETGRAAAPELENASPLVLYFHTTSDREEFMSLMREAKPGMMMKETP